MVERAMYLPMDVFRKNICAYLRYPWEISLQPLFSASLTSPTIILVYFVAPVRFMCTES